MNKKKDFHPIQSDIHTIVDLPLEAVIHHITSMNAKDYQVEITQDSSDKVNFRIRNRVGKNRLKIDTRGTICRWNGTFTRLDANYIIRFTHFSYRIRQALLLFICWVGFWTLCIVISGNSAEFGFISSLIIAIVYSPLMAYVFWLDGKIDKESGHPNSLQNLLIHGLVDELGIKLKQKAASIDFDGTDDNLNFLLSEEKHKHFRLSADGELHTP